MRVLILDEREGTVKGRDNLIRLSDVTIKITRDAVLINKGEDKHGEEIAIFVGKSEPELSMEKAEQQKADRLRDEQPAAESHITRFQRAFGDADTKDEDLQHRPDPWG